MNNINTLFYSTKCKTCNFLIQLLQKEKLLKYFKLICVDNKKNKLPAFIEAVPTMIVRQINKPLVAEETFRWVETYKKMNSITPIKQTCTLSSYTNEMKGFSDSFADISKNSPKPKSFYLINRNAEPIITKPEINDKINIHEQKEKISYLQQQRNTQDNYYKKHINNQIKNIQNRNILR